MKTLKSITEESRKFYTENAGSYFSKSFTKKMGGTQTITFEDDFLPAIELDLVSFTRLMREVGEWLAINHRNLI